MRARSPITTRVAAISVGIVAGEPRLDLDYREDSSADADVNVVQDARGQIIEIQGTAENRAFSRDQLALMLDYATTGIEHLVAMQAEALEAARSS